jgi:hypothetical protein
MWILQPLGSLGLAGTLYLVPSLVRVSPFSLLGDAAKPVSSEGTKQVARPTRVPPWHPHGAW